MGFSQNRYVIRFDYERSKIIVPETRNETDNNM